MCARFLTLISILFAYPAWGGDRIVILTFKSPKSARKMFHRHRHKPVLSTFGRYVVMNASSMPGIERFAAHLPEFESLRTSEPMYLAEMAQSENSDQLRSSASTCLLMGPKEQRFPIWWDKQLSNCDLMQSEMEKSKLDLRKISVAVVDTPIDSNLSRTMPSEILTQEGSGAEEHGTQVVSQILRCSPGASIRSYGVFRKKEGVFQGEEHELLKSITSACDSGSLVINFSASSNGRPMQSLFPHLFADLAEKGCLLIEASGNVGPGSQKTKGLDKDALVIAAANSDGTVWPQSTPADLRAPGVDVPAIGIDGQTFLTSGTSMAAPRVSSIVKNVYLVLNESAAFRALNNSEKVRLVSQIVRKTSRGGLVDGYRAISLAQGFVRKDDRTMMKARDFSGMEALLSEARASTPPGKCAATKTCEEKGSCYLEKRRMLALTMAPKKEDIEDLVETSRFSEDRGLTVQWTKLQN